MNAPFKPHATTRDPFSAFLSDLDSEDVARDVATAFDWPLERIGSGGLRSAAQSLAVTASPAVLLVDLSDSVDPMEDINGLAEVCEPGTIVIACGRINDIRFYRDVLASGIHDYLPKPFSAEQLREAITQAQALMAGNRPQDTGSDAPHVSAAVIGVRGGAGATSLAVSLAWAIAARGRSTTLLDLDVHFGTGALALDLEPGRGLTDAIDNPDRIDGLFIERALVRHGDKLGVLSAEAPMTQPLGDPQAFLALQEELRATFSCTVLDLPRHMLVQYPALLQEVGVTVVVTELTLSATRDTIRILSWLKAHAPATRVLLAANRVPPSGQEEVARREFEKSIERKLDLVLPLDAKNAAQAAKLGKPLMEVAQAAALGRAMQPLADLVLGEEGGTARRNSLLDRLGDVRALLPRKRKG